VAQLITLKPRKEVLWHN